MSASLLRTVAFSLVVLLSACQTVAKPVEDPAARLALKRAEGKLLQPFSMTQTVAAEHLQIEISPNFHNQILMPAGGQKVKEKRVDSIRWNTTSGVTLKDPGLPNAPQKGYGRRYLQFRVGKTSFLVTGTADVKILLDTPHPTFTAHARGRVIYSRGAGAQPESLREIRFTDGQLQVRRL